MKFLHMLAAAALLATIVSPSFAQEEITEFRIGILGGENQNDRLRSNECLRVAVEEALGVPTELFAPADYDGVIEGLIGGNLDLAWLGASGYAKAYLEDPDAVTPVLIPVNPDGTTGYYSIGFTRVDSGITSLDDMQGKVFAFGDPNSTSGYLIPAIEIPQAGYSMEPGEYFADIVFSGGHEQTIVGVYNGDYDAGVSWADGQGEWEQGFNNGAFRKAVDSGLVDMSEMVEIWRSKEIPNGPVVVRTSLPESVKTQVIALMADLPENDPECAYGVMGGEIMDIVPTDHSFFESIVAAREKEIGG
jgi:phosphonate transport system substrate-binding protein